MPPICKHDSCSEKSYFDIKGKEKVRIVRDFINNIKKNKIPLPKSLVSAFYMYYDEWDSVSNEEWKIITAIN